MTQDALVSFFNKPETFARIDRRDRDDASSSRRVVARDLEAILAIERRSFDCPWTREEFEFCLEGRCLDGFVVEREHNVLGYLFYELRARKIRLLSCAVAESERRQGIGSALLSRLAEKLTPRRASVVCDVRERNVEGQLFLHSFGFRAQWVSRDYYGETHEDAYRMVYTLESDVLLARERDAKRAAFLV